MSSFIPNSFQIPNAIIDKFLAKLSGNAFKCYALIARQTTGWQKQSDKISVNQFMVKCGIKDRKTAMKCLEELEEISLILTFKKCGEITEFSLNLSPEMPESEPVPKNGTSTSTKNWYTTKNNIKNNITNNKPTNLPSENDDNVLLRNELIELIEGKFDLQNAKDLHDEIEDFLVKNNFEVIREFQVEGRGDGMHGRIDLLVKKSNAIVGVELDNYSARNKSLFKLTQVPVGLVVLRNGIPYQKSISGNSIIISANNESPTKNKSNIDYQAILDFYNEQNELHGKRLPNAIDLNDKRKRGIVKILNLLKPSTLDGFKNYIEAFFERATEFYFGSNNRNWRASFDYLLREDTLTKVREGAL